MLNLPRKRRRVSRTAVCFRSRQSVLLLPIAKHSEPLRHRHGRYDVRYAGTVAALRNLRRRRLHGVGMSMPEAGRPRYTSGCTYRNFSGK